MSTSQQQGALVEDLRDPLAPAARTPGQLTHRDDPDTSFEAAVAVHDHLRDIQLHVLTLFAQCGAMTQCELIAVYQARVTPRRPDSSIRTRCAELVDARLVADTDRRVVLPSGRRAVVWAITDDGIRVVATEGAR